MALGARSSASYGLYYTNRARKQYLLRSPRPATRAAAQKGPRGKSSAPAGVELLLPITAVLLRIEKGLFQPIGDGHFFAFAFLGHRAAAAFLAIARLSFEVNFSALAKPPAKPPSRATSDLSLAVIRVIRSFASSTAALFFRVAIGDILTTSVASLNSALFGIFSLTFYR